MRLSIPVRSLAVAVFLVTPFVARSAPADGAKSESPAERIRKALDQVITIDINDQPLKLALNQLHEQTKINFVPDTFTMQQMGIDSDGTPVSLKLQNVKVKTVLRSMFGQFNLSYAIVGEAVVITTDDMAMYRQMKQRVSVDYDKTPLGEALKQLSRNTATNLLLDAKLGKEGQAPVTLQLEEVPLETAVRLISELGGLKPVRLGNVLYVTSKANANELRADPDLAPLPQPRQPGQEDVIIQQGLMRGALGGIGMPGGVGIAMPAQAAPAAPVVPPAGAEKPADKPASDKPAGGDDKPPAEKRP